MPPVHQQGALSFKAIGSPEIKESGEALWDRLVNERRVELAFEAIRYFDVKMKTTVQERFPFAGMRTMVLRNGSKDDTIYCGTSTMKALLTLATIGE